MLLAVDTSTAQIGLEPVAEEQRQMSFHAKGARYDRILAQLQRTMFGVR